jgi:hypothetical protein
MRIIHILRKIHTEIYLILVLRNHIQNMSNVR